MPEPSEQPIVRVVISNFNGMASNADPHDLPEGVMVEQVNCWGKRQGQLEVRTGLRPLTMD